MSNMFDVESWGDVRQKFDGNFLRFIRNGLAHGKFVVDFDKNIVTIKMRNDTFVVNMPIETIWNQSYNLHKLSGEAVNGDSEMPLTLAMQKTPPYENF